MTPHDWSPGAVIAFVLVIFLAALAMLAFFARGGRRGG